MKLRVCMLIYYFEPGPVGGTERQCRLLVDALTRDSDVSCSVLTSRPNYGLPFYHKAQQTTIVRFPTLGKYGGCWLNALIFQACALAYLLSNRRKFDVIHVHTAEWIAGLAVWAGRRIGIPVVCKVATQPVFHGQSVRIPFAKYWMKQRKLAAYSVMNPYMRDELMQAGIPADRIRIIPNGVIVPPEITQRIEDPNLIIFVGNLIQAHYKALDVLFAAWEIVCEKIPSLRLSVLGAGDPSLWRDCVSAKKVGDSVTFHGLVENVGSFYRRAALFVLPSRQEGMSNALIEAQSWGIPAVVSDIPANVAVVENGTNGWVVPVENVDKLADSIIGLVQDAELRHQFGNSARELMLSRFAIEEISRKTRMFYEDLIVRSRRKENMKVRIK